MVEFDYTHMKTECVDDQLVTVIIAYYGHVGAGYASVVAGKGLPRSRGVVNEIADWMSDSGLAGVVRLRSDGGPAIMEILRALAAKRGALDGSPLTIVEKALEGTVQE